MTKKNKFRRYIVIYTLLVLFTFTPLIPLFNVFNGIYSTDITDWGNWGQYVSGSVGILLSALTIILVVHSINLQKNEFENMIVNQEESLKALRSQNTDNFFFNLVANHYNVINSTFIMDSKKTRLESGSATFKHIIIECNTIWYKNNSKNIEEITKYLNSNKEGFSHYLSNLINTFSFIESITNAQQKSLYINVFKSQISNSELAFICYLCNTPTSNLNSLVDKYSLKSNIDFEEGEILENENPLVIKELINISAV
jgi:hypothetical protein